MRIPVLVGGGPAGHFDVQETCHAGPRPPTVGVLGAHAPPRFKWHIDNHARVTQGGGLYEWVVTDASGLTLAHYVGKADSSVASRIGHYWRDMSPQLVHAYRGTSPPLTSRLRDRDEKSCLRWIHLWLAWAYLMHDTDACAVVLGCTPYPMKGRSLLDQESALIRALIASGAPLVNTEAIGATNIERVRREIVSGRSRPSLPVPPGWAPSRVPPAWDAAIRTYGGWRTRQGRPFP